MKREATSPAWVACQCGEMFCNVHNMHAFECPCPPVEEWETSPYSTPIETAGIQPAAGPAGPLTTPDEQG